MKIFFSIVFLIVLSYQSIMSQNTNYKLIKQEQGVQFFAREMECHDDWNGIHQLFYQIQVINTTEMQATISWNIDTWMNGACVTCGKPKNAENTYNQRFDVITDAGLNDVIIADSPDINSPIGRDEYACKRKCQKDSFFFQGLDNSFPTVDIKRQNQCEDECEYDSVQQDDHRVNWS